MFDVVHVPGRVLATFVYPFQIRHALDDQLCQSDDCMPGLHDLTLQVARLAMGGERGHDETVRTKSVHEDDTTTACSVSAVNAVISLGSPRKITVIISYAHVIVSNELLLLPCTGFLCGRMYVHSFASFLVLWQRPFFALFEEVRILLVFSVTWRSGLLTQINFCITSK